MAIQFNKSMFINCSLFSTFLQTIYWGATTLYSSFKCGEAQLPLIRTYTLWDLCLWSSELFLQRTFGIIWFNMLALFVCNSIISWYKFLDSNLWSVIRSIIVSHYYFQFSPYWILASGWCACVSVASTWSYFRFLPPFISIHSWS